MPRSVEESPPGMNARSIGLVIAMSAEARALTGFAQPTEQVVKIADGAYLRVGGLGATAAERSCVALAEAGVSALVSVGCAAGLTPECRPGALVVPAQVRSAQGEVFSTDMEWRAALLAAFQDRVSPVLEIIAGVDRLIGASEKHALHAATGAVAADMESAAVAREARRYGLPMIAIRVVSDGADDDVPDALLGVIDSFGRPRFGPLLAVLIRNPGAAAALARLRTGFNKACSTLSLVAARTGPEFCFPKWENG